MPDPPAYNPDTQELVTHTDINGAVTYSVVTKTQEQREDNEDFGLLKTFMATPRGQVTSLQAVLALKALIRILYRMRKVD